MKIFNLVTGTTLLVCTVAGFAQSDVRCGQPLMVPLRQGADLVIDSVPAGIEIVGTDNEKLYVTCAADDMEGVANLRLRFSGDPGHGKLAIFDDHSKHSNLRIHIEVPRKLNLGVRVFAGAVKVEEITGDKDVDVTAGSITIASSHGWNYRDVKASVGIGGVNAKVYGTDQGGFFRVFHKEDEHGEYRLRAHVTTGQIDLLGPDARNGD